MKTLLVFLGLVALLFALPASAQNTRVDGIALTRGGSPAPGASVAVCVNNSGNTATFPCASKVAICSSLTDSLCQAANPTAADGLGNYFFYVPTGTQYALQLYGSGLQSKVIPDQAAGGGGSGLPSGCTGASGAISCNSVGVAYNAPNGGSSANYFQGNSNTLPNRVSIGDNAAQCPLIAGAFNFCPILGVMHVFDETGADLGSFLNVINLGQASGPAVLNGSAVLPANELATNPASCNSTTFFRGDNTCNTPNAFANASQAPNATNPGTVLNELAFPCTAAAVSCTGGTVTGPGAGAVVGGGIVTAGAGTTGNATIQYYGSVNCVFDNGTTLGDYVVSNGTGCHDAGIVLQNIGPTQLLGISQATNAGPGTYPVWLVPLVSRHVVAQGSTAMPAGTITTATCATVVTATATGANPSSDNLSADFSLDPTSTAGYSPSAGGILTIIKFITSNTVNFKVCNNTGSNITAGSVPVKWSVWR